MPGESRKCHGIEEDGQWSIAVHSPLPEQRITSRTYSRAEPSHDSQAIHLEELKIVTSHYQVAATQGQGEGCKLGDCDALIAETDREEGSRMGERYWRKMAAATWILLMAYR